MIHILAQRVLTIAPRPVETRHATQLREHRTLLCPKLVHRVLLLGGLLLGGHHHPRMMLVQMGRVWGARLHLWRDVMWGGLRLQAGGRAGVWRLGLRTGRGLWGSHLVSQGCGQRLALQVWVGGLGHLGLLRTHGIVVLGRRPPRAQMLLLLLLLEQPLVERLLQQGGWRRWAALSRLQGLRWWLGTSYDPPACITPRQARHGVMLLHLEVVLVLEPLLKGNCGLLLGHRACVTLALLSWWPAWLLRAQGWPP